MQPLDGSAGIVSKTKFSEENLVKEVTPLSIYHRVIHLKLTSTH